MIKLLISFVAGLGLGYLRRRVIQTVVLGIAFAFLLSALSLIPYKYERHGDAQHLLPLSYPLHAEIQRFIALMIAPSPPDIKLTIYLINTSIIALWHYEMSDAFFTSFVTLFGANLATLVIGTFLGGLIRHEPLQRTSKHKTETT